MLAHKCWHVYHLPRDDSRHAAISNFPKYLDGKGSRFVSRSSAVSQRCVQPAFRQARIPKRPAQPFQFRKQLSQAVFVLAYLRFLQFPLYLLLLAAQVNATQGPNSAFEALCRKLFVFFQ
jgi:hypothetical protein